MLKDLREHSEAPERDETDGHQPDRDCSALPPTSAVSARHAR
jgi:hypothetical protein